MLAALIADLVSMSMQGKHVSHCRLSHMPPMLLLYPVLQCPDFVALEAQAVSYLTQSAKYGRHTIPPEVLNRVEHSNAAAAVFDQQLQYIESTMGDAKHVSLAY